MKTRDYKQEKVTKKTFHIKGRLFFCGINKVNFAMDMREIKIFEKF